MTRALLDYPWPLDEDLDEASPAFYVLERFSKLLSQYILEPVPCIEKTDYWNVFGRIGANGPRASALAAMWNFVDSLVCHDEYPCSATPDPTPGDLSAQWRSALHSAIDPNDWRSPQIIVAATRASAWRDANEVWIQFEPCDNQPDLEPETRVLAVLEKYDKHLFAKSDLDPWDLERLYPPEKPLDDLKPCRLPKPHLANGGLDGLEVDLVRARRTARSTPGMWYFVPRTDWTYESVEKDRWRKGHAFPRNEGGWVDFEDLVWLWDKVERHWDVQTRPTHTRVSHTGRLL